MNEEQQAKQAELIERGHSILDYAPRDYSAITNLITDALAYAWEDGYESGRNDEYDCYYTCTRDPEDPETLTQNPFKEAK